MVHTICNILKTAGFIFFLKNLILQVGPTVHSSVTSSSICLTYCMEIEPTARRSLGVTVISRLLWELIAVPSSQVQLCALALSQMCVWILKSHSSNIYILQHTKLNVVSNYILIFKCIYSPQNIRMTNYKLSAHSDLLIIFMGFKYPIGLFTQPK